MPQDSSLSRGEKDKFLDSVTAWIKAGALTLENRKVATKISCPDVLVAILKDLTARKRPLKNVSSLAMLHSIQ